MVNHRRSGQPPVHSLPNRPNLEYLKNEAKSRLKLLRAANAGARLADAQLDVARNYGFASWRQLRRHVIKLLAKGADKVVSEDKVAQLRYEQARPRKEVVIDAALIDRYVGFYQLNDRMLFTVVREGAGLCVQLTGQQFLPVYPESDEKFFYRGLPAQLTFVYDDTGFFGMILHQHGLEREARRISETDAKVLNEAIELNRRRAEPVRGSEPAVRRLIDEVRRGEPQYELMSGGLAGAVRQQLESSRTILNELGDIQSMEFKGVAHADGGDVFHVRFASCVLEFTISMETDEIIGSAFYRLYP